MGRYPREARCAAVKCIRCNAPVVQTVDEGFICVECGESPLKPDEPAMLSVNRTGNSSERSERL